MSDAAKHRAANKAKANRLANAKVEKVDASSWTPPEALETTKKTGARPIGKQSYVGRQRGGKCVEVMHGEKPSHHAGKNPRGDGHSGARVGNKGNYEGGTRPTGGRIARKHGGKTGKGKTNINIIIGAGEGRHQDAPPPPPAMPIRPPGMAMPPPQGMPPAGAPAPMPMPPPGMGGMPRRSGGRAKSYRDMTAGAGTGEGRLEKTEIEESR